MSQSNNILIGSPGVAAQNATIMIGDTITGGGVQTAAYCAGIYNQTVGATYGYVLVDSTGKLGSTANPGLALTKFLYVQATNHTNATGNGALYQLGSSVALTKVFDAHNDMSTGGTFTAPVSSYYNFSVGVVINNLAPSIGAYGSGSNGAIQIVVSGTSAGTYQVTTPWSMSGTSTNYIAGADQQGAIFSILIFMTAADTAVFNASMIGAGSNVTGIGPIGTNAFTTNATFISGFEVP